MAEGMGGDGELASQSTGAEHGVLYSNDFPVDFLFQSTGLDLSAGESADADLFSNESGRVSGYPPSGQRLIDVQAAPEHSALMKFTVEPICEDPVLFAHRLQAVSSDKKIKRGRR